MTATNPKPTNPRPNNPRQWHVGLVGYGEVGRILAEDLRKQDVSVSAYDLKLRSDQTGGALRDHAGAHGDAGFVSSRMADFGAQSDFIVRIGGYRELQAKLVPQACAPHRKIRRMSISISPASPGAAVARAPR